MNNNIPNIGYVLDEELISVILDHSFGVSDWISAEILLLFFTDNLTPSWMLYAVNLYDSWPQKSCTYYCENNDTTGWNATENLFYSSVYVLGHFINEISLQFNATNTVR